MLLHHDDIDECSAIGKKKLANKMECEKTVSNFTSMLIDINCQIAQFRDLLIHIGHEKHDSAELRISIRKTRRGCVEQCIKVSELILPQMKR